MIELNEHAIKAQETSQKRFAEKPVRECSIEILKHCAGEVCEAVEAYTDYLYEFSDIRRDKLAGELADIITCALIVAANEGIDIEKALKNCQRKNEARAAEWKNE